MPIVLKPTALIMHHWRQPDQTSPQEEHQAWKLIMWPCSTLASEPCSCPASSSVWVKYFFISRKMPITPPKKLSKMTFLFTKVGVWSVLTNMTPHEDKRNKQIQDNQTLMQVRHSFFTNESRWDLPLSLLQRFTSVFGRGGLLHFLCPLLPFPSPYLEPGYRYLSIR